MDNIVARIAFAYVVLGSVTSRVDAGAGLYMGPYFPAPLPTNITVHQNTIAYLPCTVKQLGDKSVSWVRQRDADILTVDRYTFVRDERLTVHYTPESETWTLVIKFVQERDAGTYECQISTEPKMSKLVHLNVIVPQVEITGDVDKYVRKGSTARLECRVSSTVQLPDYIFWYHSGERLLEFDHPRVRISVSRRGGQGSEMSITSTLVITKAHTDDDGNYTCLPSNLHPAYTILHVLNDEHPAAMQTGAAMLTDPPSMWGIIWSVFFAFIFVRAQQSFVLSSISPCSKEAIHFKRSCPWAKRVKRTRRTDKRAFMKRRRQPAIAGDQVYHKTFVFWILSRDNQSLRGGLEIFAFPDYLNKSWNKVSSNYPVYHSNSDSYVLKIIFVYPIIRTLKIYPNGQSKLSSLSSASKIISPVKGFSCMKVSGGSIRSKVRHITTFEINSMPIVLKIPSTCH